MDTIFTKTLMKQTDIQVPPVRCTERDAVSLLWHPCQKPEPETNTRKQRTIQIESHPAEQAAYIILSVS